MMDRRELILARIFALMQTIPNVQSVWRDKLELNNEKRPAISVLDADEVARVTPPRQSRGRAVPVTSIVDLSPEIYLVMDSREPMNKDIGQDMSAFRIEILRAIFNDTELPDILGGNGDIRFDGCTTDMAVGRPTEGEMRVRMTFTYPLKPTEL